MGCAIYRLVKLTHTNTNDAVGTIPRLKDVGPDPALISDALLGIIAQRLVRRVCPHCAKPYTPTSEELRKLGLKATPENTQHWLKGKGCIKCFNSGYLGREAIVELLDVNDRVRELIYQGTMTELNRYLKTIDFTSFSIAAAEKVTTGITTMEEVFRVLPHSALYYIIKIGNSKSRVC